MLSRIGGFLRPGGRRSSSRAVAVELYDTIVRAARDPELYVKGGVPDTVDGRFDSLALHAFILMERMSDVAGWQDVGTALADRMVADMDQSLREIGIGDMSIGKKVKAAAAQLYGRFDVYWGAIRGDDPETALAKALSRNLYRGVEVDAELTGSMVAYVLSQRDHLRSQSEDDILAGRFFFLPATGVRPFNGDGV